MHDGEIASRAYNLGQLLKKWKGKQKKESSEIRKDNIGSPPLIEGSSKIVATFHTN